MTIGSKNAESQFRAALHRLVSGVPARLPPGTKVTQNNVAREAGRDPTALKKSRYPELISEIKGVIQAIASPKVATRPDSQARGRRSSVSLRARIEELTLQRDQLASMLNTAESEIVRLTVLLRESPPKRGEAGNVLKFGRPPKP